MERSPNPPLDKSSLPYLTWGKRRRLRFVKLDSKTNSCHNHGATSLSNLSAAPSPQDKPKKRPCLDHDYSDVEVYPQDDFSKLPDHIITGHILPCLDLKERVRSSMLSRRWKYLWRLSLGTNLVFPVCLRARPAHFACDCCLISKYDVVRCREEVNFIVKSFTGPELDLFSVCFEVAPSYHHVFRRWIKFAFRWKVKRLNLDLTPYLRLRRPVDRLNKFPSLKGLLPFRNPKIHAYPSVSLKELSLRHVNTPGETVEYLLFCCPFLELLSLHSSLSSNLKICGPSLKLKHLDIKDCLVPLKIEISAPNLKTLKHDGLNGDLLLNNAPLLADLHMSDTYFDQFVDEFVGHPLLEHFSYFFQLKTLEFDMSIEAVMASIDFPLGLPTLCKLEELKVTMETNLDVLMLWPIVVLKAAPNLQRFLVKQVNKAAISYIPYTEQEMEMMRGATEFSHSHLKVLEMTGFSGSRVVCEMIERVLSIATVPLEKVVIQFDEREWWWNHKFYRCELWKNEDIGSDSTREMVKSVLIKSLESIMPAKAKLVVL